MTTPLPFIPGWDVSGVVEAVGAGVTDFYAGDTVYALASDSATGRMPSTSPSRRPTWPSSRSPLDHVEAAAVPLAALTAWQSLFDAAHLSAGQTVLIHAAAGGVGTFAVQLAKWKGARVIGTASAGTTNSCAGWGRTR